MKNVSILGVFLWAATAGTTVFGQENASKAPLAAAGALNKAQPQLEQIFQFAFDGARLKLDRKGWANAAKGPGLIANSVHHMPIESIFNQIRSVSGPLGPSGMSISNRHRESYFTGGAMNGRLRTEGDQVRFDLTETTAPQRSLEFLDDGQGVWRLLLSSANGDLILLQQSKQGACASAAVLQGKPFAAAGADFLTLYRQQRSVIDSQVAPVLQALAIRLIPTSSTPQMKQAVLALLTRTPQMMAEGGKLLKDLDSEKFPTRDKASKALNERFEIYKDLIQDRLKERTLSQEATARLHKILAAHPDAGKVSQTIAALDLLRDPEYLVGLLDEAAPTQRARVVEQLEAITNQRLGADIAGWKRWLEQKK